MAQPSGRPSMMLALCACSPRPRHRRAAMQALRLGGRGIQLGSRRIYLLKRPAERCPGPTAHLRRGRLDHGAAPTPRSTGGATARLSRDAPDASSARTIDAGHSSLAERRGVARARSRRARIRCTVTARLRPWTSAGGSRKLRSTSRSTVARADPRCATCPFAGATSPGGLPTAGAVHVDAARPGHSSTSVRSERRCKRRPVRR
jgi:hypothetical protein